jgi:hypothetical protein
LQRQFGLDDACLEDLEDELVHSRLWNPGSE